MLAGFSCAPDCEMLTPVSDRDRRRKDVEVAEVVEVASALAERAETDALEPDARAVAAELGIPDRFVDAAVVEVERRRRRRRFLLGGVALALAGLGGVFAVRRATAPRRPLDGRRVAFDLRHGLGSAPGGAALTTKGAVVSTLEAAFGSAELAPLAALIVLEARRSWTDPEIEAIVGFVRGGGGLVLADVAWSWTHYDKRPLVELAANRLLHPFGAGLTDAVLGPPTAPDPARLGGIGHVARPTPWVPGGLTMPVGAQVLLTDDQLRPMGATMAAGAGRIALFGHAGILLDNPAILAFAAEQVARRV